MPRSTPPPKISTKDRRKVAFTLGLGSRYYSEDYFLETLEHLGLTRAGFRAWCRALGVPLIFIGRSAFINIRKFEIALEAISHIGQPDFLVPGCRFVSNNKVKNSSHTFTRKLDPAYVEANYETFVAELLIGYLRPSKRTPRRIVDDAYRTARQWALYEIAHRPQELQSAYAKKALAAFQRHKNFDDLRIHADPDKQNPADPDADTN